MSPRQYQLPPANLQNMYKFEHGSFTKFAGTGAQQQWPGPPLARPTAGEYPPQNLQQQTRAPGQAQLAPKPPPDPVAEIMTRIYSKAPQLAPKPLMDLAAQASAAAREAIAARPSSQGGQGGAPPPQQFHSGFRPINAAENQRPAGAPKPMAPQHAHSGERQEGGRHLAPKPPQSATQQKPYPTGSIGREQQQAPLQMLPLGAPYPPLHSHHSHTHSLSGQSEPHTPGGTQQQQQLQSPAQTFTPKNQGQGPHLAPAPPAPAQSPSALSLGGPTTGGTHPPSRSQSHSQPQSHPASPPPPATPSTPNQQASVGVDMDASQTSARGRSFRDIVMS